MHDAAVKPLLAFSVKWTNQGDQLRFEDQVRKHIGYWKDKVVEKSYENWWSSYRFNKTKHQSFKKSITITYWTSDPSAELWLLANLPEGATIL